MVIVYYFLLTYIIGYNETNETEAFGVIHYTVLASRDDDDA